MEDLTKNNHDSRQNCKSCGVLLKEYLFCVPGQVLWTTWWGSYGVTDKSHSSQLMHGEFLIESPQHVSPPPSLWKRYVDNTFLVIKSVYKDEFLDHINSVDQCIHFTLEDTRTKIWWTQWSSYNLMVSCPPQCTGSSATMTSVYSGQLYYHFSKRQCGYYRARTACSNPQLL